MDKPKSLGYNLFIDKSTSELLQIMINVFQIATETGVLDTMPNKDFNLKTFEEFGQNVADALHEQGWCQDPECEYNQE